MLWETAERDEQRKNDDAGVEGQTAQKTEKGVVTNEGSWKTPRAQRGENTTAVSVES
jgi:hypothetical protein